MSGVIDVTSFGATGNGTTDDTAAILVAVAAIPPTGGVLFFPPGTYKTTMPILVTRSSVAVRGVGDASQIDATVAGDGALVFSGGSWVRAQDLRIIGKFSSGIWLRGCSNASVTGCSISGATDGTGAECSGITISNCSDVWIQRNRLDGNGLGPSGSSSADIGTGSGSTTNSRITVADNHCTSTLVNVNIGLWNAAFLTVEGKYCSGAVTQSGAAGSGGYGIMVYQTHSAVTYGDAVVAGNIVKDVQGTGIYVQGCPRSVISGNLIENSCITETRGSLLVGAIAVTIGSATIAGNEIHGSKQAGIIASGTDITVSGNTVISASTGGIVMNGMTNSVVSLNTLSGCGSGIATSDYINGTAGNPNDRCSIVGNVIRGSLNGNPGIALKTASHGSLTGNVVDLASGPGVLLQSCTRMTLTGNTARESSHAGPRLADGIRIEDSTYCIVANNQSYGTKQAYGIFEQSPSDHNDFTYNGVSGNLTGPISLSGGHSTQIGNRTT